MEFHGSDWERARWDAQLKWLSEGLVGCESSVTKSGLNLVKPYNAHLVEDGQNQDGLGVRSVAVTEKG